MSTQRKYFILQTLFLRLYWQVFVLHSLNQACTFYKSATTNTNNTPQSDAAQPIRQSFVFNSDQICVFVLRVNSASCSFFQFYTSTKRALALCLIGAGSSLQHSDRTVTGFLCLEHKVYTESTLEGEAALDETLSLHFIYSRGKNKE